MSCIYLDNNATTPLLPAVLDAMTPYLTTVHGNPASSHQAGRKARQAVEDARERVASLLEARPDEVVFTSGATESNNLAIQGLCGSAPGHILAGPTEHPSVSEPVRHLEGQGFAVGWLAVDPRGAVSPESLAAGLREDTRLVTIQLANHETGAVQPIQALAHTLGGRTPFHCDAAQAVGKIPVRFRSLGVSTLALSGHKLHGPKGIGALLVHSDVKLAPGLRGGHQQRGRRPGTEPVALAVGLAAALEMAERERESRLARVLSLRRRLLDRLRREADPVVLNGPEEGGIPHTINLSFPGVRADLLLMRLDLAGVACSTGSACSSGSLLPSPVLRAMGVAEEVLHSAMRFSLSFLLSEQEIDDAAERVADAVRQLRK